MTKHCMFSLKAYPTPENFIQPLVAIVVTFCMPVAGDSWEVRCDTWFVGRKVQTSSKRGFKGQQNTKKHVFKIISKNI